ncbi:MAG: PilZ domain-containing protein [Syntrophales bacterium]
MSVDDDMRSENRKYCRVEACIPFAYRLVPPEERKNIQSHISSATFLTGQKPMPEIHDPSLAEWINLVNVKLDTIIQLLTLDREGFQSLPFECVNISAGGLRFLSQQRYAIGDTLELRMMLSLLHPVALYVYATVLSVSERRAEGDYDISVEFIAMDNAIQDEIIRFVFEREREIIRVKKGQ